jgi:hypothetical protein
LKFGLTSKRYIIFKLVFMSDIDSFIEICNIRDGLEIIRHPKRTLIFLIFLWFFARCFLFLIWLLQLLFVLLLKAFYLFHSTFNFTKSIILLLRYVYYITVIYISSCCLISGLLIRVWDILTDFGIEMGNRLSFHNHA